MNREYNNVGPLSVLSLFSGGGGLDMGARIVGGFRTIAYVENEPYAQAALMSNMRKGILDPAPIWDDVRTFAGKVLLPQGVDVLAGGFPCQDVSVAGKRAGIKGERSGLWFEFARIIREVGPRFVLVENVPGLIFSGGLGDVLGALADGGYNAEWDTLSAAQFGAPHLRRRVFIVAYTQGARTRMDITRSNDRRWETSEPKQTSGEGRSGKDMGTPASDRSEGNVAYSERPERRSQPKERHEQDRQNAGRKEAASGSGKCGQDVANAAGSRLPSWRSSESGSLWNEAWGQEFKRRGGGQTWWEVEPNVGRVANGVAFRVQRLRLLGNGVVPLQSVPAWKKIKEMAESKYYENS